MSRYGGSFHHRDRDKRSKSNDYRPLSNRHRYTSSWLNDKFNYQQNNGTRFEQIGYLGYNNQQNNGTRFEQIGYSQYNNQQNNGTRFEQIGYSQYNNQQAQYILSSSPFQHFNNWHPQKLSSLSNQQGTLTFSENAQSYSEFQKSIKVRREILERKNQNLAENTQSYAECQKLVKAREDVLERKNQNCSPPLGSEEARKKKIAQTTDKVKKCLKSFQNKKPEMLEDLLSSCDATKKNTDLPGILKNPTLAEQELQLTASDLRNIGIVSKAAEENNIEKSHASQKHPDVEIVENSIDAIAIDDDDETLSGVNAAINGHTEKQSEVNSPSFHNFNCEDNHRNSADSSKADIKKILVTESECSPSRPKRIMNNNLFYKRASLLEGSPKFHNLNCSSVDNCNNGRSSQYLKQKVIQQLLKANGNTLKDFINNPTSRKAKFVMKHLVKEHGILLSRKLRELAQASIKRHPAKSNQSGEESFFIDPDIAVNLSALPSELIMQLGNLLELDLNDFPDSEIKDTNEVDSLLFSCDETALASPSFSQNNFVKPFSVKNINSLEVNNVQTDKTLEDFEVEQSNSVRIHPAMKSPSSHIPKRRIKANFKTKRVSPNISEFNCRKINDELCATQATSVRPAGTINKSEPLSKSKTVGNNLAIGNLSCEFQSPCDKDLIVTNISVPSNVKVLPSLIPEENKYGKRLSCSETIGISQSEVNINKILVEEESSTLANNLTCKKKYTCSTATQTSELNNMYNQSKSRDSDMMSEMISFLSKTNQLSPDLLKEFTTHLQQVFGNRDRKDGDNTVIKCNPLFQSDMSPSVLERENHGSSTKTVETIDSLESKLIIKKLVDIDLEIQRLLELKFQLYEQLDYKINLDLKRKVVLERNLDSSCSYKSDQGMYKTKLDQSLSSVSSYNQHVGAGMASHLNKSGNSIVVQAMSPSTNINSAANEISQVGQESNCDNVTGQEIEETLAIKKKQILAEYQKSIKRKMSEFQAGGEENSLESNPQKRGKTCDTLSERDGNLNNQTGADNINTIEPPINPEFVIVKEEPLSPPSEEYTDMALSPESSSSESISYLELLSTIRRCEVVLVPINLNNYKFARSSGRSINNMESDTDFSNDAFCQNEIHLKEEAPDDLETVEHFSSDIDSINDTETSNLCEENQISANSGVVRESFNWHCFDSDSDDENTYSTISESDSIFGWQAEERDDGGESDASWDVMFDDDDPNMKKNPKRERFERIQFDVRSGCILDVKTVGRHVLAASEDKKIYCYSVRSGKLKNVYRGHTAPVTCLCVISTRKKNRNNAVLLFSGSHDQHLRCFNFKTGKEVIEAINVGNPILCIDESWGKIFLGTKSGEVITYSIKSNKLAPEPLKCSSEAILSLKALKEGPRKVLLVGSRNKAVAIRDAETGLFLRCLNLAETAVYSLKFDSGLVYCGTSQGSIPVFDFVTGKEIFRYKAGIGVVCIKIYNDMLFCACYDGRVYIYNLLAKTLITSIPGPGKMLMCLDVVKNRIIAGSKDRKLEAWIIPGSVKKALKEIQRLRKL